MTERASLRNGLQDFWGTMRLIFGRSRSDAGRVYDVIGPEGALGENSLFLNLGYWKDTSDYDEAAAALARELGKVADIQEGDVIVDAGFGFGDQDILWARECKPLRIVGFNLNAMQVERAQARVKAERLADVIELRHGSILETGLQDESVDVVLALESAFHFDTREKFFKEAFRVLRAGGRIGTADVAQRQRQEEVSRFGRLITWLVRAFWQIPKANYVTAEEYTEALHRVGFEQVSVRPITEHVILPVINFMRQLRSDPIARKRIPPLLFLFDGHLELQQRHAPQDYVIATAYKPKDPDCIVRR